MKIQNETKILIMSAITFALLMSGVFAMVLVDMKENYKNSRSTPCTK